MICYLITEDLCIHQFTDFFSQAPMVKEDMGFRRFLLRSAAKVEVEWSLLSLAYNVLKLHHKIQTGRLGTGLVVPKGFPAGL